MNNSSFFTKLKLKRFWAKKNKKNLPRPCINHGIPLKAFSGGAVFSVFIHFSQDLLTPCTSDGRGIDKWQCLIFNKCNVSSLSFCLNWKKYTHICKLYASSWNLWMLLISKTLQEERFIKKNNLHVEITNIYIVNDYTILLITISLWSLLIYCSW